MFINFISFRFYSGYRAELETSVQTIKKSVNQNPGCEKEWDDFLQMMPQTDSVDDYLLVNPGAFFVPFEQLFHRIAEIVAESDQFVAPIARPPYETITAPTVVNADSVRRHDHLNPAPVRVHVSDGSDASIVRGAAILDGIIQQPQRGKKRKGKTAAVQYDIGDALYVCSTSWPDYLNWKFPSDPRLFYFQAEIVEVNVEAKSWTLFFAAIDVSHTCKAAYLKKHTVSGLPANCTEVTAELLRAYEAAADLAAVIDSANAASTLTPVRASMADGTVVYVPASAWNVHYKGGTAFNYGGIEYARAYFKGI